MKHLFTLLLVTAALTACGGSGGNITPPTPHPTPTINHIASISFTSLGRSSQSRTSKATCPTTNVSAPTVLQAEVNWNPPASSNWSALDGYAAQATEYDVNCNVISTTPTFTINDPTLITTTQPAWLTNIPTPPPGGENVFGVNAGLATITATFADGTTGTAQAHVYGQMGVGCTPTYYLGSNGNLTRAWTDTSGQINGDSCGYSGTGSGPFDITMDANGTNVLIPGGYQIIESASPTTIINITDLANVTSCSAFASQGTTLQLNGLPPAFMMVFKTQDGKCVKFFSQNISFNSLVGMFSVSDSSGNFSN